MAFVFQPIENAAIKRAEMADPNFRRCLIENCSKTCAVELVHVFSRETPSDVVKAIEWNWGMRKGSLNLDTRQNVFFLGASIHELYKTRRWALLPEESALDQYHGSEKLGFCILPRDYIPKIENERLFKYRLLPIHLMEDVYLTRQNSDSDGSVTIHHYPFEDLPVITSHVNPRYAILHLGELLGDPGININTLNTLMRKHPLLDKIEDLYMSWTQYPDHAEHHPSFVSQPTIHHPVSTSLPSPHENCTPLRRIPVIGPSHQEECVTPRDPVLWQSEAQVSTNSLPSVSSSATPDADLVRTSKKRPAPEDNENDDERPRKRLLTCEALKTQKMRRDLASAKWSKDKITLWTQDLYELSHPAIPLPSPPTLKPQPLRRSARLSAKRKRRSS